MRIELKYVVPVDVLPSLRAAISPFMRLDSHCEDLGGRVYTVRSIYLDSPSLRYYYEKQNHLRNRKKLRIRGYNEHQAGDLVFLEIKRKIDSAIAKERAAIRYEDLLSGYASEARGELPEASDQDVCRRVFYHVRREHLLPTCLVVYEREAFQGRFDRSFRVTFDSNLRGSLYPSVGGLYEDDGFREAMPGSAVVEIKYHTRLPAWMRPVIAQFGLVQQSASKYCICVDLFDQRPTTKTAVLANASRRSSGESNENTASVFKGPAVDA